MNMETELLKLVLIVFAKDKMTILGGLKYVMDNNYYSCISCM